MRSHIVAIAALALAACSTAGGRKPAAAPVSSDAPALQRFVVAVQLLPDTATEASRSQVSDALRRLSDALRESARGDSGVKGRAERIRALAGELDDRTPSAPPPDILARALREAVGALGSPGGSRARREVAAAENALRRLDTSRPVLAQVGAARAVLGHVANGLLVARGLPPVDLGSDGGGGADSAPGTVDGEAARRASGLVGQLATASSTEFRAAVAAAIEGFALALEPAAGADPAQRERVQAIREDVGRIRRTDTLGPEAAPLAKAALESAVQAVGAITEPLDCPVCRDWISRARAALNALDPHTFLAFQRGPLQEACRLLADVLVVAAEPTSRGPPAR